MIQNLHIFQQLTFSRLAAPFDPRNSGEAWRYVRNRVWTGEAFIYASPPRPEEPMDFDPSQNPFFSKNGTSEVSGSPQAGESSYFGNPQGSGSGKNNTTTRSLLVPSANTPLYSFRTSKLPWHDKSIGHEKAPTTRQGQVPICRVER